jgi:hypothetical protein
MQFRWTGLLIVRELNQTPLVAFCIELRNFLRLGIKQLAHRIGTSTNQADITLHNPVRFISGIA